MQLAVMCRVAADKHSTWRQCCINADCKTMNIICTSLAAIT